MIALLRPHFPLFSPLETSSSYVPPGFQVRKRVSRKLKTFNRSFSSHPCRCGASNSISKSPDNAKGKPTKLTLPLFPKSINEIDNGAILGFGAELDTDHPGFHDQDYKRRRQSISDSARLHQMGTVIPHLEYQDQEVECWAHVLNNLQELFPKYACREYLSAFSLCGFSPYQVPQLEDMSSLLQRHTGWAIRPVAGLLHPRSFLNGLAFKIFHSTQYIRHHGSPMYTPEPDICHELIGHVPMLLNPDYSALVHAIGIASLGADEKQIWHLTRVYWYTVEFGVVFEADVPKAFGAGILSSFGELEHCGKSNAEIRMLDPYAKLPKMSYKDGYQTVYFALKSFKAGSDLLKEFSNEMKSRMPP